MLATVNFVSLQNIINTDRLWTSCNLLDMNKKFRFWAEIAQSIVIGYGLEQWGSIHGRDKYIAASKSALGLTKSPIQKLLLRG